MGAGAGSGIGATEGVEAGALAHEMGTIRRIIRASPIINFFIRASSLLYFTIL
jgi:hypothetical protein